MDEQLTELLCNLAKQGLQARINKQDPKKYQTIVEQLQTILASQSGQKKMQT